MADRLDCAISERDASAVRICEAWLDHIDDRRARAAEMQRLAAMARRGDGEEARRRLAAIDRTPQVFDGATLEPAVRHLVDTIRARTGRKQAVRPSGRVCLVTGGRDWGDGPGERAEALECLKRLRPDIVIHGGARGADLTVGAQAHSLGIHVALVPALWGKSGKAAGPLRNRAMLLLRPDYVLAFPGGTGTADMVEAAKAAGVPVYRHTEILGG